MNIELNKLQKGILLLSSGLILLLYSTGLLTTGIDVIFVITSLLMLTCGFYLVDGPQAVRNLFVQLSRQTEKKKTATDNKTETIRQKEKKKSDQAPSNKKKQNDASSETAQNNADVNKKDNSQK